MPTSPPNNPLNPFDSSTWATLDASFEPFPPTISPTVAGQEEEISEEVHEEEGFYETPPPLSFDTFDSILSSKYGKKNSLPDIEMDITKTKLSQIVKYSN